MTMTVTMTKLTAFVVLAAGTALPAAAQFAKPEDAIKYRQGALFVLGQHFARIGAMSAGRVPFDPKLAAENADLVVVLSKLPWAGFGPGTEGGKAKDELWKEQPRFREFNEKLEAETTKLAAAAKTGSLDNLKSAFGAVASACKNCHDAFRQR